MIGSGFVAKKGLFAIAMLLGMLSIPAASHAQYFRSQNTSVAVLKSSGLDSVILERATQFAVPVNDTIDFTYHEPMPDSLMPRSAMVIGTIRLQAESPEDVVDYLEKYARKAGADWIVSFAEPRAMKTKNGDRIFRATATLLRVLDPTLINEKDLNYSYYETSNLHNYAEVNSWYDSYGRHMGAKLDTAPAHDENDNFEEESNH